MVVVCYCVLLHFSPPCMWDDLLYRFVWPEDNDTFVRPVRTVGDVLQSQIVHYNVLNGRFLIHFLAQLFEGVLGKGACDIASALLLGVFVWLASRLSGSGGKICAYTLFSFFIFVAIPGFHNEFLWFVGVFNYLWAATFTLVFIAFVIKLKDKPATAGLVALSSVSFFAGGLHEGITLPVFLSLVAYCAANRRRLSRSPLLYCTLFYGLGVILCVGSPGTMNRIGGGGGGSPFLQLAFQKAVSFAACLLQLRVSYLMIALSALARYRNNVAWIRHFHCYRYVYLTWLLAFIPVLGSGSTETRTFFYPECIAMFICCGLVLQWCRHRPCGARRLTVALNAVLLTAYAVVLHFAVQNSRNCNLVVKRLEAPSAAVVAVPHMAAADNRFVKGYVREPVKFGAFENAQAFVPSDPYVRCLRILYHKKSLCLLPSDIVGRMLHDDIRPGRFVFDGNRNIVVVRLAGDRAVTRAGFALSRESDCQQPFYRRLFRYGSNFYWTPQDRFATLTVGGRRYLVVCCPTNNIKRRIEKVVY